MIQQQQQYQRSYRWLLSLPLLILIGSMMIAVVHSYHIFSPIQYHTNHRYTSSDVRIYSSSSNTNSNDPSTSTPSSSSFGTSPSTSSNANISNNGTTVLPFMGSSSSDGNTISNNNNRNNGQQSFGATTTTPSTTTTSNKVSYVPFFGMKPNVGSTKTNEAVVEATSTTTTNVNRNATSAVPTTSSTTATTVIEQPSPQSSPKNTNLEDATILSQLQQVVEEVFLNDDNEYEHEDVPVTKNERKKKLPQKQKDVVTTPAPVPPPPPSSISEQQQQQNVTTKIDVLNDETKTSMTSICTTANNEVPAKTARVDEATNIDFISTNIDTDDDIMFMKMAIELAESEGGEHGPSSAYPNPTTGAILVSTTTTVSPIDGSKTTTSKVIGRGRSDYRTEAVRACLEDAGISITPLSEWVVSWPIGTNNDLQSRNITLYTTLEPSTRRRGTATPPVTNLIRVANIQRIVIGCPSPVPEKAMLGASALHNAGIIVKMIQNDTIRQECEDLISDFAISSNSKLQRMARKHYQLFGRPLGFLHCSVIHSDNIEAFRRHGNAFGTNFAGTMTAGSTAQLSFRNLGSYELAPPPDNIWATEDDSDDDFDTTLDNDDGTSVRIDDEFVIVDFEEEEEYQGVMTSTNRNYETLGSMRNWGGTSSPMMPWYNQVDAVVVTFPRSGNGPPNDDSITSRLNGIKWLATHGNLLAAGVERIVVCDATELRHLPLSNSDPNLPRGVDIESFWLAHGRKPTRIILRRGVHEAARAAATASAVAAQAAAKAAQMAADAIESGDATKAAAAAMEYERAAMTSKLFIEQESESTQIIRRKLEDFGVIVETIEGGEPIDIMEHLGERNGLYSVVWRAGCWGERGVRAILAGAFQWVSAHIAVPADGGRFWQLMMAENAVQGACGPRSKVKVFADQDDISMEYCNEDDDCVLSVDGKPIRHVRLDCRVALMDGERKREFDIAKTQTMNRKVLVEQAPWFL